MTRFIANALYVISDHLVRRSHLNKMMTHHLQLNPKQVSARYFKNFAFR